MKVQKPSVILFDIDNTFYPYPPCHQAGLKASQAVARRLSRRWNSFPRFSSDYETARRKVKSALDGTASSHNRLLYFKQLIETHFQSTHASEAQALQEAYWKGYFSKMKMDPGCLVLLKKLRAQKIRIGLLSDHMTDTQLQKMRLLKLNGVAERLITSEEVGVDKPSARMFNHALKIFRVSPKKTWMIGDEYSRDILGARRAGLFPIWIQRQKNSGLSRQPWTFRTWAELERKFLDVGIL